MTRKYFFLSLLSCIPFVGKYFKDSYLDTPEPQDRVYNGKCLARYHTQIASEFYQICLKKAYKKDQVFLMLRYKTPDDVYHVDTFFVNDDNINNKDIKEIHELVKKEFPTDPLGNYC